MMNTNLIQTRRGMLMGSAGLAIAGVSMGQLAGCSTTPSTVIPAVIDIIQKAVAGLCSIVPVVQTVVDVIVAVFPAAAGVATITDALAAQIAQYVCTLFTTAGLKAGEHPGKLLTATVGNNSKAPAIELHCFQVVGGKLVYV
jgi:hypothetical protein